MDRLVVTNVCIYKVIADEAYQKMAQDMDASRRPKSDGSSGWIITFDSNQIAFKQAMISIVFTGIWLEALLHNNIVKRHCPKVAKKNDGKDYENKLKLLDCNDQELLARVSEFSKSRNSLVHEKAYLRDDEILIAQTEAKKADELRLAISNFFSLSCKNNIS